MLRRVRCEATLVALKHNRAARAAELCEGIAVAEGIPEGDVNLAWLCGLFHGIGRFEQLRIWGTFKDSASCSHAELGLAVLDGERSFAGRELNGADGRLCLFCDDGAVADVVRLAAALHSGLHLPEGLDARTRCFCEIVRDADKMDIIRVFGESDVHDALGLTPGEFVRGEISDAAMAAFREGRCLGPDERKANLDGLVGVACLPFEIVSGFAREELSRLGYLRNLLERPFGLESRFELEDTASRYAEIKRILL